MSLIDEQIRHELTAAESKVMDVRFITQFIECVDGPSGHSSIYVPKIPAYFFI